MLEKLYGSVVPNHRVTLATRPGGYADTPVYPALEGIYRSLQQHRGLEEFVRADYVDADFFIPDPGFVVEFDESQHFTEPRLIALENYPAAMQAGYSVPRWKELCASLDKHDNDPPFRDEQRAWYDTLRDFLPEIKGYLPTVRLYAREMVWCVLDPEEPGDVERFRKFLEEKRMCSTLSGRDESPIEKPGTGSVALASHEALVVEEPATRHEAALPQGRYDAGEQEANDTVARRTGGGARPVPESLLRFGYLTNAVKLRYLGDCFTHPVNRDAPLFTRSGEPVEQVRLTSSNGKPFMAYTNRPTYVGGRNGSVLIGPLFSSITSDTIPEIQEITAVNAHLYRGEMQTGDWLRLFCEYTLVKTVIHELITDTEEHERDWGYGDLRAILDAAGTGDSIGGAHLREIVIHALRLGLDPSSATPAGEPNEESLTHLSSLPYRAFMAHREEWVGTASSALAGIRSQAIRRGIHSAMKWDRYSMCAFESGPIFIRREPDWLLPQVTSALASYSGWNNGLPADRMMTEILSPYLHVLIGSYWHHFQRGCEVRFFEEHREFAETIPALRRELDGYWAVLCERAGKIPSMPIEGHSGHGDRPKSERILSKSRDKQIEGLKSMSVSKTSFEHHREKAQELGLGEYFERLTTAFATFFPVLTTEPAAVIYRVQNVLDYPEVDVFNLYTWGSNKDRGLKFRVYYNVLAKYLSPDTSKEDILMMLPGIVRDKPRKENDAAEWFFEGYFTSKQEIEHLLAAFTV
ncbi:hypothetical protein [Methanoculleus sp.]|uniref:hypothetical protein n=1 Tax=Methanoculleus sp. TaxID=90427 RepID=UPI0025EF56D4|nr:hypothetical protein [Methanoculleus sp.]